MMQWLLSSQSLLLTCELVFSKMMKAGIFWLIKGGLHPTSHQHPSLSLGKAQSQVVFHVTHSLLICSSTSIAVVVVWFRVCGFIPNLEQAQLLFILSCKMLIDTYPRKITNLKQGLCCRFFVIFLYANGRMVLGLFSIDFVYHVLCVCCILVWFKAKITCNKR